jgi:hypothetical protein
MAARLRSLSDKSVLKKMKADFLEKYRVLGAVGAAAKSVKIHRDTIHAWRKSDKKFDAAVLDALEDNTDTLRLTAFQRAMGGTSKNADVLLMFLLKARDPKTYRDNNRVPVTLEDPDGRGVTFKEFAMKMDAVIKAEDAAAEVKGRMKEKKKR